MDASAVHGNLRVRFGDAIADYVEPQAGDPVIDVAAEAWHAVARHLRDDAALRFDLLRMVSGVDFEDSLASVYHLYSITHNHAVTIRVRLDREGPVVASVVDIWPAADWHERESWDLLGIRYEGHPNLQRMFLPEDWPGHPLRKDYIAPEEYHGIPNN